MWEGETLQILGRYERKFAHRLPELELRNRALQKLSRAKVTCRSQLGALISKIVRQVLVDYGREKSRHLKTHVYDYTFDWPTPEPEVSAYVEDRIADLFDENGPLDEQDKILLRTILEDPANLMRSDGSPNQSALGHEFQVSHTTIGRRWAKIRQKLGVVIPDSVLAR